MEHTGQYSIERKYGMASKKVKTAGKKRIRPVLVVMLAMGLVILIFVLLGLNSTLETTFYTVTSEKLPAAFDGYRIVQLTDFHCYRFKREGGELLDAIWAAAPDIVVLTGDILDKHTADLSPVEQLLAGLQGHVPVYAVAGNHEYETKKNNFEALLALYEQYGVVYLEGSSAQLVRGGEAIALYGAKISVNEKGHFWVHPEFAPDGSEAYSILLNHFSNSFDTIAGNGFDLVLSGHAHGGIVRIPGVGGVFDNGLGLFPKYDSGVFTQKNCTMISCRGLGDTLVPRLYNRRELVCVTLSAAGRPT